MAVLVEFAVPKATQEQMFRLEELTGARGDAAGGPPYPGLMFLAVVPDGPGFRIVSTWRNEGDYRAVLEQMLAPDAAQVGIELGEATVSPVLSMAMPGAHG